MTMQNHRLRGLRESVMFAYNPMPSGLSQRDLLKAAGLPPIRDAATTELFRRTWKYGTGLEAEVVELAPGDPETAADRVVALRASEARDFLYEMQEVGFVTLRTPDDLRHVLTESIAGCERAFEHYDRAGRQTLIEHQMKGSYNEQEMKQLASRHWVSYVNEQAALVLRAHIEKLNQQLEQLPEEPRRRKSA